MTVWRGVVYKMKSRGPRTTSYQSAQYVISAFTLTQTFQWDHMLLNSFELFSCTTTDLFHQAVHFKTCPAVTGCIDFSDTPGLRYSGTLAGIPILMDRLQSVLNGFTVGVFSTKVRPYNVAVPWTSLAQSVLNAITPSYLPPTRFIPARVEPHLVIYIRNLQQQSPTVY